jgi:hypothetical protein
VRNGRIFHAIDRARVRYQIAISIDDLAEIERACKNLQPIAWNMKARLFRMDWHGVTIYPVISRRGGLLLTFLHGHMSFEMDGGDFRCIKDLEDRAP